MRFTARARLETGAHASRVQSDQATYDLERTVVGSVVAGATADRCGQCGACDRAVVSVAVGDRKAGDVEMTDDAYRQLMKHAHRLAMDGHGELAQFLRDAMTDAQRYSWLRGCGEGA